jgi:hypothetical protein
LSVPDPGTQQFPYNGKLCINGHEFLKRKLARRGIAFEALDNGILSCADPKQMQLLADELGPEKIDALARKWFRRLPHPFPPKDRAAGFRYEISILQAEFSLTQVLDRPLSGRFFFEQVIRDNLDAGRPDQVQLPARPAPAADGRHTVARPFSWKIKLPTKLDSPVTGKPAQGI